MIPGTRILVWVWPSRAPAVQRVKVCMQAPGRLSATLLEGGFRNAGEPGGRLWRTLGRWLPNEQVGEVVRVVGDVWTDGRRRAAGTGGIAHQVWTVPG